MSGDEKNNPGGTSLLIDAVLSRTDLLSLAFPSIDIFMSLTFKNEFPKSSKPFPTRDNFVNFFSAWLVTFLC